MKKAEDAGERACWRWSHSSWFNQPASSMSADAGLPLQGQKESEEAWPYFQLSYGAERQKLQHACERRRMPTWPA